MITRHQLREEVVKLLYNVEFMNISIIEAKDTLENVDKEAFDLASKVLVKQAEIDGIIEKNLVNYTLKRLNAVDRAIIRLAVYELLEKQTPSNIVINEAIELTKQYTDLGDKKAVRFNNKLLDNINKAL